MNRMALLAFVVLGPSSPALWHSALAEDSVETTGTVTASGRLEVKAGTLNPRAIVFTPPPPPKPVPPMVLEAASAVQKPTHTITLLRGEPSTLPDIQRPVKQEDRPSVDPAVFPAQRPNFLLGLSVTVYDHALSYLKWHDPETREELEAWCGWDWGLVAPMQEISNDSVVYNLFFSPWRVDTTKLDPFGRRQAIPDHPAVGVDEFVISCGNAESTAGHAFLEAVQRYCIANRTQLVELRAARDQYRADAEAWRAANPPKPENHTIWIRPHRGSRYLLDSVPEAAGETSTEEGK